ncbi:hypothetical protein M8J77_007720 [Diaphorina citri]|nr:hypothetical protein M8J77_007720 [Diaphorina citri]
MDDRQRAKTEKTAAKRKSLKEQKAPPEIAYKKGFEDWNKFRNKYFWTSCGLWSAFFCWQLNVDKLISIELEQNEILEKLDMLQKTVNHLMTRREAASSSTELQDLLKKLPLKTPLDFEIFQDNLTDSGQRALTGSEKKKSFQKLLLCSIIIEAIEGSTFVIGNRIEYVRVIRDYLSQAQNRINNREKSAMFKKHNIYEEAIWK